MTVFTIHEPPLKKHQTEVPPERIAFVRDGFYFWAFVLGPLWMLWHRLVLVLVLYLVGTGALQVGLWLLGVSSGVKFIVGFLIALLVGFEAASLRRFSLRRWRSLGLVVAPNQEMAERRFFETWATDSAGSSSAPLPPGTRVPTSEHDVIGLFPEPEPRR